MKRVSNAIFTKKVPGGIANEENTIMKVEKMAVVPGRFRAMMKDLSTVTDFSVPNDYDMIKVTNQTGHASYFEASIIYFAKSLENATIYLSNIPEPGMRWHGGHIFVKAEGYRKRLGVMFRIVVWYIMAPVEFETVEGFEENLRNKVSEKIVPVEI